MRSLEMLTTAVTEHLDWLLVDQATVVLRYGVDYLETRLTACVHFSLDRSSRSTRESHGPPFLPHFNNYNME